MSRIIMGTAWFSPENRAAIDELLGSYLEAGGNTLDVGRFYGMGKSEVLLSEWLNKTGCRDELIIIDKCCHPFVDRHGKHHPDRWRVSAELITEDLVYSLDRVGVDSFDLYLMHRDDPKIPVSVMMDRLEQHYRRGQIKAYGVSNWQLDRMEEAEKYCNRMGYRGLSANSSSYSLATVKIPRWPGCVYGDDNYATWHKVNDIPLLSWGAQGAGFFAEIYPADEKAPLDIREAYCTKENYQKLARAKELGARKKIAPINIALSYILCQDLPLAAIIGPRNKEEFTSTIASLGVKLTPEELDYLSLARDSI